MSFLIYMIMMIFLHNKKIAASALECSNYSLCYTLDLIELVLALFALLVSNAAGSLACGLAGSLTFAASTCLSGLFKIT